MKNKYWIKNFIYLFIIILLYFVSNIFDTKAQFIMKNTFKINSTYIIFLTLARSLCICGIGAILGLDSLLNYKNKQGKCKLNMPKLIILGVPSFILSLPYILFTFNFWNLHILFFLINNSVTTISNIVFGYILISSFIKID